MNKRLEQTEGGRLKQARHQLDMTLKEFAEKINYNDANLSKMERNLMAINDNVVKKLLDANINALVIKFGDEQKDINGTTYLFDDEDGNIAMDGYKILNRFSDIKISEYKTEAKCQVRVIYSGNNEFFFTNGTIMFLDYFTPFPQSDSLDRLISLLEILGNEEYLTPEEIAEFMEFNIRQSDYYYNAGKYLELVEKVRINGVVNIVLNQNGKDFVKMGYRNRILFLVHLLARHHIFREGLLSLTDADLMHHNNNELYVVAKETIVNMMVLMNMVSSPVTANRRAQTVRAWLFWLKDVITELD